MPEHFGPFSQIRDSVHSSTTSSLAQPVAYFFLLITHRVAHAMGSSCAAVCVWHPKVPWQGGTRLFQHHNLAGVALGSVAAEWARAGPHLCCRPYRFRLAGERWLLLLGAGLASR